MAPQKRTPEAESGEEDIKSFFMKHEQFMNIYGNVQNARSNFFVGS